jgi:hypothetical protein
MYRRADDVLGKAQLGPVGFAVDKMTGNRIVLRERAVLCQRLQHEITTLPGDDGVFAALVLLDDERLQEPVRGDRCGKLADAVVCAGLAHVAGPGHELG